MAQEFDKVKTCKVVRKGLMYVNADARHYNLEILTDEQAISLLKRGIMKESDFEVLPGAKGQNYSDAELNCIIEIAEQLKDGVTKKAIREKYKDVELIGEKPCNIKLINELIKEAEKSL